MTATLHTGDAWAPAGQPLTSRLLLGSAGYPSPAVLGTPPFFLAAEEPSCRS